MATLIIRPWLPPDLAWDEAWILREYTCEACDGQGGWGDVECRACDGQGVVTREVRVFVPPHEYAALSEAETERALLRVRYGTFRPPSIRDYWVGGVPA
ncbi:MAG: hypothetical protein Kow00120_00480 [Anaerolineae bacterium]